MLRKLEWLLFGDELKTKTRIEFAVKCAEDKTLQTSIDTIIGDLVFHAYVALDDIASNIGFVCARGNTGIQLNPLSCEAEESKMKHFFSRSQEEKHGTVDGLCRIIYGQ